MDAAIDVDCACDLVADDGRILTLLATWSKQAHDEGLRAQFSWPVVIYLTTSIAPTDDLMFGLANC